MRAPTPLLLTALLLLTSCAARSISDSGVYHDAAYIGELHDLNVLGTLTSNPSAPGPVAPRGARIVLVQSGSPYPDDALMSAFAAEFEVLPLSGVPLGSAHSLSYSRGWGAADVRVTGVVPTGELLQAAARAGRAEAIVVVWGLLEGASEAEAGKAVSWVPRVGYFVPDEVQALRIRLKAALIDPDTGRWRLILPDALDDSATSSPFTRDASDQEQVRSLKLRAYPALAKAIAGASK